MFWWLRQTISPERYSEMMQWVNGTAILVATDPAATFDEPSGFDAFQSAFLGGVTQ